MKGESFKMDDEEINDKWLIVSSKLRRGMKLEDIPEAQGMVGDKKK